jgi:cytochrome c oxidase cbb3-type subunit III
MKKIFSTVAASALAGQAMSQSAEPVSRNFLNNPLLPMYVTAGAVLLLLILVALVAIYVIRVLNYLTAQTLRQQGQSIPASKTSSEGWWKRFVQKMNASVPVEQEKDIEMDHSYDGIKELDNHLPPWWKWLFYGTIGWAVVYLIAFHLTDTLPLSQDEYKRELALAEEQIKKYEASQPKVAIDENTLEYSNDATSIANGKTVFINNNCGGCHRNDGGGNTIGPNLADEYWLHGGEIKKVFQTIKNGVVEKGMPAWGKSMSAQDVRDVTFFVLSLQGTNPPDAKAPQGEIFKTVKTSTDSVKTQAGL